MISIGLVVLHYRTEKDTIKCVDSFLKCSNEKAKLKVLIIDNHSTNGSFEFLKDYYAQSESVSIISAEYNLGFARGNNYGVKSISKHGSFDYIICSNNDVYVTDYSFLDKLGEVCEDGDVIGPDVIRVCDHLHQNPLKPPSWTKKSLNKRITSFRFKYLLFSCLPFLVKDRTGVTSTAYNLNDYSLHGSFLIFSKKFCEMFDYEPFYPKTFLYLEEDFLFYRCKFAHLTMKYCPSIFVWHNHSSSTKSVMSKASKRRKAFLKNQIVSLKLMKEYLSEKQKCDEKDI